MEILAVKWIVVATLFISTFIFSMLPLKLMSTLRNTEDQLKRARYGRIISLLSCFAGGVFMGTGLLDLFPEVNEMLSKSNIDLYLKSSFPVAEFTVAFGFFLILVLEQIVLEYKEKYTEFNTLEEIRSNRVRQSRGSDEESQSALGNDVESSTENASVYQEPEPHPKFRSVILLLALSLHSLFEGLAIGLQSDMSDLIQVFVAVLIHKVIIAFSLGLNLVQTELSVSSVIKSNFLFSVTSPLGMCIAIALEEFGQSMDSSVVNGILQGLACGTFVYVTFFEVLPHELNSREDRLFKLLALLLGFSMVCCVLFLNPVEPPLCPHP